MFAFYVFARAPALVHLALMALFGHGDFEIVLRRHLLNTGQACHLVRQGEIERVRRWLCREQCRRQVDERLARNDQQVRSHAREA